jgi:hypothetical protein
MDRLLGPRTASIVKGAARSTISVRKIERLSSSRRSARAEADLSVSARRAAPAGAVRVAHAVAPESSKATTEMMIGNQVAQSIAMNLVCCPRALSLRPPHQIANQTINLSMYRLAHVARSLRSGAWGHPARFSGSAYATSQNEAFRYRRSRRLSIRYFGLELANSMACISAAALALICVHEYVGA